MVSDTFFRPPCQTSWRPARKKVSDTIISPAPFFSAPPFFATARRVDNPSPAVATFAATFRRPRSAAATPRSPHGRTRARARLAQPQARQRDRRRAARRCDAARVVARVHARALARGGRGGRGAAARAAADRARLLSTDPARADRP